MFPHIIPKHDELNLKLSDSIEGKLELIDSYTRIEKIYCEVTNPQDYDSPHPKAVLHVVHVAVPPGEISYVKSRLKEDCLPIVKHEIKQYVQSTEGYENIKEMLESCIGLCETKGKENDATHSYSIKDGIEFYVNVSGEWVTVMSQYINFSHTATTDLQQHFEIRKGFYSELQLILIKALQQHQQKTDFTKNPYYWDSRNASLEITELIYILYVQAQRIKINEEADRTFATFKRDFFGFFGLSDKDYDKKISQIRARKKGNHFIDELSRAMPKTPF